MDLNSPQEGSVARLPPIKRVVIAPPAAPGSKGDEGMIRGAMSLLEGLPLTIVNPEPDRAWQAHLAARGSTAPLEEVAGPLPAFASALEPGDLLFVIGADVIDGTCGIPAALDRLELMRAAQARGLPVLASCSFRSAVARPILEELAWHRGVVFLMRDSHSLENLRRQTGIEGHAFPDLSFFLDLSETTPVAQSIASWCNGLGPEQRPRIGVNFAEHSFRSFSDTHSDAAREEFVGAVMAGLASAFPEAAFVLLSNDARSWPNHISDDAFSAMALDWVSRNLGGDRATAGNAEASYVDNIAILRRLDLLVTGRMHLSFAALRAGTPPVVLMGQGKGYSSIDKMRGAFVTHLRSDLGVVSDIGRLGDVARRVLAAEEIASRVAGFEGSIRTDCTEAKAWLFEHLREHEDGSRGASVAVARRTATARCELLTRDAFPGSGAPYFADPAEMRAALDARDAALAARDAALDASDAALAGREAALTSRDAALDARDAALAARDAAIAARDAALAERDAAAASAAEAERRAADAEAVSARQLQSLVDAGDLLAEDLRRSLERPWRPLKRAVQRAALRAALLLGSLASEARRDRLRRSLDKRLPTAPRRDWDRVVAGVLAEADLSLPHRASAVGRRRSALAYQALTLLADLSEPVSPRRAERFRRSAAKRAPGDLRRDPAALPASGDDALTGPEAAARCARRILVAEDRLPRRDLLGGERATEGLLGDLVATGYDVVFLPADMADDPAARSQLASMAVRVITRADGCDNPADYIAAEGHRFGVFYLIGSDVAEALLPGARRAAPGARIIVHAPDLTSPRNTAVMEAADHAVLASPAGLPQVPEIADAPRISVIPALRCPVSPAPLAREKRAHVFFRGGFGDAATGPSVRWFVDEVWPRVRAHLPEVEFHILGTGAPPDVIALGARPGVRLPMQVGHPDPDVGTYMASVAPLRSGAGIGSEIGMALGAGVPTVTTSVGAAGLGLADGVHALVRDDSESFAQALIEVLGNAATWEHLSLNGRHLVAERFGDHANRAALLRALEAAGALPHALYREFCEGSDPLPLPDTGPDMPVDVSIVVRAHDRWPVTSACLNSVAIACRGTGVACEVVLAGEAPPQAADLFPGLRVMHLDELKDGPKDGPRAGAGALNAAAALTRGGCVLIIDAATVAMPNWLSALHATLRANPRAGLAGSIRLDAGGSIRAAGGVLFADGSALRLGQVEPAGATAHAGDREVDFVDLVAMMVRREVWEAAGGWNADLPAEIAGPDLAMAARAIGRPTWISAGSVVVSGEEADEDRAVFGNARFAERWRTPLETAQRPPGTPPAIAAAHAERTVPAAAAARRRTGRLNVLYFSPFPSHPDNHGNQATIQSFGRRFQRLGHEVHFVLLESTIYDEAALRAMRAAWDTLDILPNSRPLWSDGSRIPFDHWYQPGLGEQIAQLCHRYGIDVVFCSYVFQSKLLDFVPAHVLKVIDTHDKMGDRHEMLRRRGQPVEFFSCTPEEEGRYLRRADVVVARRAEEAAYFDGVTGRQSAIVIPHVEDARFTDRAFGPVRVVGMVASANRINLAITLELLKALAAREEDGMLPFSLHLAGQVSELIGDLPDEEALLFSRPWVKLLGFVPDIAGFYGAVDLVVSPVTMGTGINVKTVQAMAFGMPLVTTAWGSKGIETGHPMHAHADVEALVEGLFGIAEDANAVNDLARVSRERYTRFLAESDVAIAGMFGRVEQ